MILTIEQMMPRDELRDRIDSLEDFVYDKVKDSDCAFDSIDGKIEELYNLTGKFENCVKCNDYYILVQRVIDLENTAAKKYNLDTTISRINNMDIKIADLEKKMRQAGF